MTISKRPRLDISAEPSPDGRDACGSAGCWAQAAGLPLRSQFGFTVIEDITLDLYRFIGQVYATGHAGCWDAALQYAEERLGLIDGPVFVARVTSLIRAIRVERNEPFSFMSPCCRHISDDERALLGAIAAARRGDLGALALAAVNLARGVTAVKIEQGAKALASLQLRQEASIRDERLEVGSSFNSAMPRLH